jgi:hypothetical protein
MRRFLFLAVLGYLTGKTFGQSPAAAGRLSFEVASLKPSGPRSIRGSDGGPGSRDPERFTFGSATLRDLLFNAYRAPQDDYHEQISGPGWIDTERYDIAVKMPRGTTKEQFQLMLQTLLAERFNLAIHHDTKVLPVYDLVVGKNGPKLRERSKAPILLLRCLARLPPLTLTRTDSPSCRPVYLGFLRDLGRVHAAAGRPASNLHRLWPKC